MAGLQQKHAYAAVSQADLEDMGVPRKGDAKRARFPNRELLNRQCGFVSIVAVLVLLGIVTFVRRQSHEEGIDWVEGFPAVDPWTVSNNGASSLDMDEKSRHKVPFLVDKSVMDPVRAKTANTQFLSSVIAPGDKNRFISHMILDKPVYRPGEIVYASVFLIHAIDTSFLQKDVHFGANVQVKDAKNAEIDNIYASNLENSVLSFSWSIPRDVNGGDFKFILTSNSWNMAVTQVEREFEVRATRSSNPKIRKKLDFDKDGYAAAEQVTVILTSDESSDETEASFSVTIDSMTIVETEFTRLEKGTGRLSFTLPGRIERPEGVVTAKVRRNGLLESTSKSIPILSQMLDLGVFPEGGVLVAGLQQRVYVEALDPLSGKPVDFSGYILSDVEPSKILASIDSLHEGRGVSPAFIVPSQSTRVYFKVTSPASAAGQTKELPLRVSGVVNSDYMVGISLESSVFRDELKFQVLATVDTTKYDVTISKREIGIRKVESVSGSLTGDSSRRTSIDLTTDKEHYGVLRFTVFTSEGLPVAERLVFRMPPKVLEIEVSGATVDDVANVSPETKIQSRIGTMLASPSDGVTLDIKTWTRSVDASTGNLVGARVPVSAIVALRVSDSAMPATVENRLLPPRLPEALLLESEVDRLNDAGMFLPGSAWAWTTSTDLPTKRGTFNERLDILLGTQGWRAFAYYDAEGFIDTGRAPLVRDTFVPAGIDKTTRGASSAVDEKAPVTKTAIRRMMGLAESGGRVAMAAGGQGDFVMAKRAPQRPMMMRAFAMNMDMAANNEKKLMVDAPVLGREAPGNADDRHFEAERDEDDEDVLEEDDLLDRMPPPAEAVRLPLEEGMNMAEQEEDQEVPMMRMKMGRPAFPATAVRVYAHPQRKYLKKEFEEGSKRADFTETVYFNPSLKTQCLQGTCSARVSFGLSDASGTSFIAHADGFVTEGQMVLGCGHLTISTASPFEIDFNLPSIIVSGDRPSIPLSITNRAAVAVEVKSDISPLPSVVRTKSKAYNLAAAPGARVYVELIADKPVRGEREFNLTFSAASSNGDSKIRDAVTRTGIIMSKGFPTAQFSGGTLKLEESKFSLALPDDYVFGSVQASIRAYTSPLGRLNKALEELIREPYGCFEQTSSTTYPLVFVLQYLKTHSNSDPIMIKRAQEMLTKGYEKLVSYESPGGGFEWFGGAPGHEALTAYGLLQFAAMAHPTVGIKVDTAMVERTKRWMDSRRDQRGGFRRNERALDSFGSAPESTTNAYITWALVRAGLLRSPKKDPEIDSIVKRAMEESQSDPYIIALASLSLYDATDPSAEQVKMATNLAERLTTMQDETDGAVRKGAANTITRSQGEALEIETTALSVLVWLHDSDRFAANARQAIDFIAARCKNGRFASTQATALSLMAIVEFDRVFSKPLPLGSVQLLINGKIIETLAFGGKSSKTLNNDASSSSSSDKNSLGDSPETCRGGSVWASCGTACPLTCESPEPRICTRQCVPRCQCPEEKPLMSGEGVCVRKCERKSDADQEGILTFNGDKVAAAIGSSTGSVTELSMKMALDDKTSAEVPSIPYSISFKYSVVKPVRSARFTKPMPLVLTVKPEVSERKTIVEGDVVTIRATLRNVAKSNKGESESVPMVVAIIGIPGGFEPRTDQLRELKQSKIVDFVESKPGQVILYWRALKPDAVIDVPIQATAVIPGIYESPASRAYLFYTDEDKTWVDGFQVKIEPGKASGGKSNLFW